MTQTIEQLQAKNAELTKAATCWEEQAKMLQHQNDEAFTELRSEIDELTAEVELVRAEKLKLSADFSCHYAQALEVARRLSEAEEQLASAEEHNAKMNISLRNCLFLAVRYHKEEWADHITRFCAASGVTTSVLRKFVTDGQ